MPDMTFEGVRRALRGILSAAIIGALALAVCALASCTSEDRGRVVARVGDDAITVRRLMNELVKRRGPTTLVTMIDSVLIAQGAQEQGISVTGEQMELRWERAMAEAGSEADMRSILERRGMSEEQLRERLRRDLLLDRLARETMSIHEQEIKDFYREHRDDYRLGERAKGRMILLGDEASARAILESLQAGGDFAGLAKAVSEDPATADEGGDMGWFEREDYAEPIAEAAFAAEPGATVGPIEAPDGWVILRVEDRAEPGYQPLEEVREEVRSRIERAKLPSARETWIRQAREAATIRITDDDLRAQTRKLLEHAPPPEPVTLLPVPPPQ